MATHSRILAWRIPWTEEPGRLQSMGLHRVRDTWVSLTLGVGYLFTAAPAKRTSTGSLASQRHPGKFPKVPGRRRGPVHRPQRPAGSTHSSTRGLRPPDAKTRASISGTASTTPYFLSVASAPGWRT